MVDANAEGINRALEDSMVRAFERMNAKIKESSESMDMLTRSTQDTQLAIKGYTAKQIEDEKATSALADAIADKLRYTKIMTTAQVEETKQRVKAAKTALALNSFKTNIEKKATKDIESEGLKRLKRQEFQEKISTGFRATPIMANYYEKALDAKEHYEKKIKDTTGMDLSLPVHIQAIIMAVKAMLAGIRQAAQTESLVLRSTTGGLAASREAIRTMNAKFAEGAFFAGISSDKMVEYMNQLISGYATSFSDLRKMSSDKQLAVMADQVIDLTNAAAAFNMDTGEAIGSMVGLGAHFGMTADSLATSFKRLGIVSKDYHVTLNTSLEILSQQGEVLKATGVGFNQITDETYGFISAIDKFRDSGKLATGMLSKWGALMPELAKAGLKAFSEITPEAYLAYKGEGFRDIGEAMYEANVQASSLVKGMTQRSALMGFARQGTGTKESISGRYAMLSGLDKLGGVGFQISDVLTNLTDAQAKALSGKGGMEQLRGILDKVGVTDESMINTIGVKLNLLGDPMQKIQQLMESMVKMTAGWFVAWASKSSKETDTSEANKLITDLDSAKAVKDRRSPFSSMSPRIGGR